MPVEAVGPAAHRRALQSAAHGPERPPPRFRHPPRAADMHRVTQESSSRQVPGASSTCEAKKPTPQSCWRTTSTRRRASLPRCSRSGTTGAAIPMALTTDGSPGAGPSPPTCERLQRAPVRSLVECAAVVGSRSRLELDPGGGLPTVCRAWSAHRGGGVRENLGLPAGGCTHESRSICCPSRPRRSSPPRTVSPVRRALLDSNFHRRSRAPTSCSRPRTTVPGRWEQPRMPSRCEPWGRSWRMPPFART